MTDQRPILPAVQQPLQRVLQHFEPLRPELYRYCRYLTKSPWDAEDLAQDALGRAFVTLGRMLEPPTNPRAWLFRVASNVWIDRMRREQPLTAAGHEPPPSAAPEPRATREAAGTLLVKLTPQERAAVVLSDVFELSNEDIAQALGTSVGAVKTALHRGRGKLNLETPEEPAQQPSRDVLNAFCDAFNARDLTRLTALLLDTASVEVVGWAGAVAFSPGAARDGMFWGMLFGSELMATADPRTGMDPKLVVGVLPQSPRCELRVHRGETLLLFFYAHTDGEAVRAVTRLEPDGEHISRLQNYFFNPELNAEVCSELGVPYRSNGYSSCFTAASLREE